MHACPDLSAAEGGRPFRRPVWLAALLLWALACLPAQAQTLDFDDVLPVDEALVLSAHAVARDRIEIRWEIAEGYYLYRHRTGAQIEHGFKTNPLQLPAGTPYKDEFFGDVETYRGRLVAVLTGAAADGIDAVAVQVRYQGCADAGICYPPQTRTLQVALPAAATSPAARSADAGFAALGQTLGSGGAGRAPTLAGGQDALPPERAFAFEAIAGDGDTILMRFTPAPGYYLYRDRNRFAVEGDDGIRAAAPRWPAGTPHHDEHFGAVTVYFDAIDVPLPLVRSRADAATVTVAATFQGCQTDGICYPPMTRRVEVALPAGRVAATAPATAAQTATDGDAPGPDPGDGVPDAAAPTRVDDGTTSASESADGVASPGGAARDNADRTQAPAPARTGILAALALALLGGLVLNLMPCVLPILSLKVLGLARSGGDRRQARSHALWYTAGVLVAFAAIGLLVIGLRAAGQALGWGFQLQQPWFVAALVYLMFGVGLSLSGVFTLGGGGGLGQALASRSGPVGDFFTGVLACVVASPCIAPFMGGALAFAFTASTPLALAVFLMLGLGLALPFLLIGLVPALADRLPTPGAWMETLKQVLAFPMYLTALWLLWVFGRQLGVNAMALLTGGLVLCALGLWWFERARWTRGPVVRAAALALVALSLLPAAYAIRQGAASGPTSPAVVADDYVPYAADRLAALRAAGTPVFVNMTADWCVTCKANERRVLSQPAFRDALEASGATYMVGDWTNVDPEIGAFLEAHGAVGVPLYVVYPRGGGDGEVLPALLNEAVVRDALARAGAAR